MPLSDVCLSCTSGLSREQRGIGRSKLVQKAHVTRDSDTTFKVKRSPGRFNHRCVVASGTCSGGRENVLAVGNCCYVAVCSAAQGASAPKWGRGGVILWRPPAYSLFNLVWRDSGLHRQITQRTDHWRIVDGKKI